jgi:hypothetical protein
MSRNSATTSSLSGHSRDSRRNDRGSPPRDQIALARLIKSGRFDRHLRRMRSVYAARRSELVEAIGEHAPNLELTGLAAGFHDVAQLPEGANEAEIVGAAAQRYRSPDNEGAAAGDRVRLRRCQPGRDQTRYRGHRRPVAAGIPRVVAPASRPTRCCKRAVPLTQCRTHVRTIVERRCKSASIRAAARQVGCRGRHPMAPLSAPCQAAPSRARQHPRGGAPGRCVQRLWPLTCTFGRRTSCVSAW